MKKFRKFLLLLIPFIFMFSSCVNIVDKPSSQELSIAIGEETCNNISKSITDNKTITFDTELKVICKLLNKDNKQVTFSSVKSSIKNLKDVKLHLDNIPFGNDYTLILDVYYKDYLIYSGDASNISVSRNKPNISVPSIALKEKHSAITYKLNGGQFSTDIKVVKDYFINDNIDLTKITPVKENKHFMGWYLQPDFSGEQITKLGTANYFGDVVLYAKWFNNQSTITYDTGKTSIIKPRTVDVPYTLLATDLPTDKQNQGLVKDGHIFEGWYLSDQKINKGYVVQNDITLTAKWTIENYNIVYNVNGGSFDPSTSVVENYNINSQEITLPIPTRNNFTFNGWFTDIDLVMGQTLSIPTGSKGNKSYYAKWTENGTTAEVTIESPNGQLIENTGTEITLNCSTPGALIYYTLDGSDPLPSETNKGVPSGTKITIKEKATLKAFAIKDGLKQSPISTVIFSPNVYNVIFQTGYSGYVPSIQVLQGEKIQKPQTPNRSGYSFVGWIKTIGVSPDYDELWDFDKDLMPGKDITLTAKWTANTYEVVYDPNANGTNGIKDIQSVTKTYTYDQSFLIGDESFRLPGYNLKWRTKVTPQSVDKVYNDGDLVSNLVESGSITLYAQRTPINYKVRFDLDGGKTSSGISTIDDINAVYGTPFTLPSYDTFTKDGYTSLNKWKSSEGVLYNSGTEYSNLTTVDGEIVTFTAQWNKVPVNQVTNVVATTGDKEITLSWNNPSEAKIVRIVCEPAPNNSVIPDIDVNQKTSSTYTVIGLNNGTKYTFKLYTIDQYDDESSTPSIVSQYPMNPLTTTPRELSISEYTSPYTLEGGPWKYIKFGDWPQSLKSQDVKLSEETTIINGWYVNYGSDGNYYTTVVATPHPSVSSEITSGNSYVIKLEPIVWRVLTDSFNGNKLLFAEKALDSTYYYKDFVPRSGNIAPNNYEKSNVRAYLNGLNGSSYGVIDYRNKGFINKAFTKEAQSLILTTDVDNSAASTYSAIETKGTNAYECGNTTDKVFLLSKQELSNKNYGFTYTDPTQEAPKIEEIPALERELTDYAKVTGASRGETQAENNKKDYSKYSYYWTRSPSNDSNNGEQKNHVCRIYSSGSFIPNIYDPNDPVNGNDKGIVPAIVIGGGTGDSTPPSEVKNLTATTTENGTGVVLNWLNPTDSDFNTVSISYSYAGGTSQEVSGIASQATTHTVTGLTSGTSYTFTVKAKDNSGNLSNGIKINCTPYKLPARTTTLKLLTNYNGSVGTSGKYYEFGDWPQSVKDPSVRILKEVGVKDINGLPCYIGSDNCYYVEAIANPHVNAKNFTDNTPIISDKTYYFKVEPIKWRCIDNYVCGKGKNGKLLVAENALFTLNSYDKTNDVRTINGKTVQPNNYQYSTIRSYLNGIAGYGSGTDSKTQTYVNKGFINQAFSQDAQGLINNITVDNSVKSTFGTAETEATNDYACSNTEDKVFLLSKSEVTNPNYGFVSELNTNKSRKRLATDYTRAIGSIMDPDYSNYWSLRSPIAANPGQIAIVKPQGDFMSGGVNDGTISIVPAIVTDVISDSTPPSEVGNLTATSTQDGNGVVLSWENPTDSDFNTVSISYTEAGGVSQDVTGITPKSTTYTVTGLTSGTSYTFTVKAKDNSSNVSNGVSISCTPYILPTLTKTVTPLSNYEGSAGPTGKYAKYVKFGDWPQTLKSKDVKILEDIGVKNVNGLSCYVGNDNCYYVKVDNAQINPDINVDHKKFNDNTTPIEPNVPYYFKMEPIVWRVLVDNYNPEQQLLLCESIIDAQQYGQAKCEYNDSNIKNYLNNDFYVKAFTDEAKLNIIQQPSDRAPHDKVFLLTLNMFNNPKFELSQNNLKRSPSDYALVHGINFVPETVSVPQYKPSDSPYKYVKYSNWWIRNNYNPNFDQAIVSNDGSQDPKFGEPSTTYNGIVPVIVAGTKNEPTVTSLSIPNASTSKAGFPVKMKIYGNNFITGEIDPSSIKFYISNNVSPNATFRVISNTMIEGTITIPQDSFGSISVKVSLDGRKECSGRWEIANFPQIEIGDVFLSNGKCKKSNQLSGKDNVVAVCVGFNESGIPLGMGTIPLQNCTWIDSTQFNNCVAFNQDYSMLNEDTDVDGSDNWDIICNLDETGSPSSESEKFMLYPMYHDVKENYPKLLSNLVSAEVKKGWYIPTLLELKETYKNIQVINDVLRKAGSETLDEKHDNILHSTVSVTKNESGDIVTSQFRFMDVPSSELPKDLVSHTTGTIRPVRQFWEARIK